jgi:hypothetical protein
MPLVVCCSTAMGAAAACGVSGVEPPTAGIAAVSPPVAGGATLGVGETAAAGGVAIDSIELADAGAGGAGTLGGGAAVRADEAGASVGLRRGSAALLLQADTATMATTTLTRQGERRAFVMA